MMKLKIKSALLALALTASMTVPAHGSILTVSGENLWDQSQARMVGDTTYVGLRWGAETLAPGCQVSWEDGEARVNGAGVRLTARPGEQWLTVNDRVLYLPDGVHLEDGVTTVPLRALAAALGADVEWDRQTGITLTPGSGIPAPAAYGEEDLYWLSRIISAESRGEPLEGKLAVGTVVLNRVASDEFPNTIREVIFDRKFGVQFTPTANGTVYDDPTEESLLAAKLVLEGARAAGDSLYFIAPELTDNHWTMENQSWVTTIGCHWFYK